MPIHHAVLALLADESSYGYELKARFEHAIGPQWGELNIGHLYQVLDRLERDALVTKRVVAQTDRPNRVVYRLTRAGRQELEQWLATPFVRSAYRDELFLKLMAAGRLGANAVHDIARVQREAYHAELAALRGLARRHRDDALASLLIDAATLHTKADLRVVELAEASAERLANSGVSKHGSVEQPAPARDEASSA